MLEPTPPTLPPAKAGKGYECWDSGRQRYFAIQTVRLQKLVRDMSVGTLVIQPLGTSARLQKLVRDMSVGTGRELSLCIL